eukprot:Filipodium_phascolosomae@DN2351_c0_g1_i1.p1
MSGADKKADTQRTDVTECFNFFDQDHDGKLQPNQVGIALRSLGQLWTEKELAALKAEFEGKLIGLEDFMKLMARKPIVPQPEQAAKLVNALRIFDRENTGRIGTKELRHVLTSMGEKLTDSEFDEVMRLSGINPDEQAHIDYVDFVQKMTQKINCSVMAL